ncbi:rRNA methyltransferase [Cytophagales bacterium LB-30]|uniref:rRNA methyltransferase n=1 Tax=Shiella aurantiaca TaxID=3058365 RepID=A0ABT8F2M8_9BACT|nr:rRNA methyltransferase [Shiella aurantiaca]MDN4164301.1 rRNA methyltransferase [Shiella aurantiaca]
MLHLPEAFIQFIHSTFSEEEAKLFLSSLEAPAPVSIRLNPGKSYHELALGTAIPWSAQGYYLPERPSFTLDPLLHAGAYYVQEASSMFIEQAVKQHLLPSEAPLAVLDLCAAPGGKSTHLSTLIGEEGLLVSNEVIKSRANILSENVQKWGLGNTVVCSNDPEDFQVLEGFFDAVLIDAPCSGEGMFRKDPASIKEWSPEHVQLCSARQRRIVKDIWPALKQGGVLMYSTCTYNTEENEENLAWLAEQEEVECLSLDCTAFPEVVAVEWKGMIGYHFYPHKTQGEGFFLALVRKKGETDDFYPKKSRKSFVHGLPKADGAELSTWLLEPTRWHLCLWGEHALAFPEFWKEEIEYLINNLKVVSAGVAVAEIKQKNKNPLHGLAMSQWLNHSIFPMVEVDREMALRYLKKEDIMPNTEAQGWVLICYKQTPLGWIKKMSNRANNYYPKEWRIRMDINWAEEREK